MSVHVHGKAIIRARDGIATPIVTGVPRSKLPVPLTSIVSNSTRMPVSKAEKAELRRLSDETLDKNGDYIDIKALKLQLSSAPKFAITNADEVTPHHPI